MKRKTALGCCEPVGNDYISKTIFVFKYQGSALTSYMNAWYSFWLKSKKGFSGDKSVGTYFGLEWSLRSLNPANFFFTNFEWNFKEKNWSKKYNLPFPLFHMRKFHLYIHVRNLKLISLETQWKRVNLCVPNLLKLSSTWSGRVVLTQVPIEHVIARRNLNFLLNTLKKEFRIISLKGYSKVFLSL